MYWNFSFVLGFQRGEGAEVLKDILKKKQKKLGFIKNIFKKNPGISRFVTLPFKIIDKRKLHPCKFQKFVLHLLEIPHFFLITDG